MFEIFRFAFDAVFPIILLILLGYFLRRINLINEGFLKVANKLVFTVFLPCLLFYNIYKIESFSAIDWGVVLYSCLAILALFAIGLLISLITTKDNRKRGVIWQCVLRSNFSIIGIPLAEALGGSGALGYVSVLSAFSIPLFNILSVIALCVFTSKAESGEKSKIDFKKMGLNIVKNPLLIGVALGLVVLGIRSLIPTSSTTGLPVFTLEKDMAFIFEAIKMVGRIASPLALVVLGGMFSFKAMNGMVKEIIVGTASRLVLAPLLGIGVAYLLSTYTGLLSLNAVAYPALVALFASPVATTSAIMAQEMGGDEQLAAQYVVWTSLMSIFTIFIAVVLLKSVGLI